MKSINNLLKERRKLKGLTMKEVAKAVGVSEGTVSRWESGEIANMGRSKIYALSKILDLSPAEIMGITEEPKLDTTSNKSIEQMTSEEIIAKFQKLLADKSIKWARAMPVYNRVILDTETLCNYRYGDCICYTRIDNYDDFDKYICLSVPDNGLLPRFSTEDIALVLKTSDIENEKYYYILLKNNGSAVIRKISIQKDALILQSDNPSISLEFIQRNDIVIVGKVIVIQKNEKLL